MKVLSILLQHGYVLNNGKMYSNHKGIRMFSINATITDLPSALFILGL